MRNTIIFLIILFLFSCSNSNKNETLQSGQDKNTSINTQVLQATEIVSKVNCTGRINFPNKNKANITSFINGYIKYIYIEEGQNVKFGTLIASLRHPDILKLQQKYLDTKYYIELYKKDYKRQGELTVDNAISIKKMDNSKTKYFSKLSLLKSLELQLKLIGINTDSLNENNYTSEIKIYSPINGTISKLYLSKGSFVSENSIICQVIDNKTAFLKLEIPLNSFQNIKSGQEIEFYLLNDTLLKYKSKVNKTCLYTNTKNNTAIINSLSFKNKKFVAQMPIKANIITGTKQVNFAPPEFILSTNNRHYILIKQANKQIKTEINIIKNHSNNIEFTIIDNSYSYPITIFSQK